MTDTFALSAVVVSRPRRPNLRVEAWDAKAICPDLIDVAITDTLGHFEMRLDRDYLAGLLPSRIPTMVFRIFDGPNLVNQAQRIVWEASAQQVRLQIPLAASGDQQVSATIPAAVAPTPTVAKAVVSGDKAQPDRPAVTSHPANAAAVDAGAAPTPSASVVRGTVLGVDGAPATGVTITALDRNLVRGGFVDAVLGADSTDSDGRYEIRYAMPDGVKVKADLVLRIGQAAPLSPSNLAPAVASRAQHPPGAIPLAATVAESPLQPAAPTAATIDLGMAGVDTPLLSEYHTLLARVQNILGRGGADLADLAGAQLDYAANSAGVQVDHLADLSRASRMEHDTAGSVSAEIFYGLLRTGHRGGLPQLLDAPLAVHRARLKAAIKSNIISASFEPQLDAVIGKLQNAQVTVALPASGATVISAALANALSPPEVQADFLRRWLARPTGTTDFWTTIRTDPTFAAGAAADIELTLRLDRIFQSHQPALGELRHLRQAGTVQSLRDLARWDDTAWRGFLARVGTVPPGTPGDTPQAQGAAYQQSLETAMHRLFPTEHLRTRAKAPRDPVAVRYLPRLLSANPTADPTRPLPDNAAWGDIAASEQDAARAEWAAFQREALTFRHIPARSLAATIVQTAGTNPVRHAADAFLSAAVDLDLESGTLEGYLANHPASLDSVAADYQPHVINHLKASQRVLRVTGKPEATETLMADGLDSAVRIVGLPRAVFAERYAEVLGGDTQAHQAYSAALSTAATAQYALTTAAQSMTDVSPWVIRGGSTAQAVPPDRSRVLDLFKSKTHPTHKPPGPASWPTLFDTEGWCDCDDCRSVCSPAAYLVDLLHMIDTHGDTKSPADRLFERRPDLQNLALSCENTNTTLPCLDLVNEILETHIAANTNLPGVAPGATYDSAGSSPEESRAVPQHVIDGVYDRLANNIYPLTLPFHRPLAVTRAYLDQLATSYHDTLDAFGPPNGAGGLNADERLAAETLGLSREQFKLIADLRPDISVARCYGFADADTQWQETLRAVPELLARTAITYDDLVALTKTYFLNPGQEHEPTRLYLDPPKNGDITHTHLRHAGDPTWNRLHRFIRLWHATGWTIPDLDRALFALGTRSDTDLLLDRHTVRRIGLLAHALSQMAQPLTATLTLWSDIDTWGADALYLNLFQSRTIANIADTTVFALDTLDIGNVDLKHRAGQSEVKQAGQAMSAHRSTILAALRITGAELDIIISHAIAANDITNFATPPPPTTTPPLPPNGITNAATPQPVSDDPVISLHNLTVVYRYTVLANIVGLPIRDLVDLLTLTGATPFVLADPAPTLRFIEHAVAVRDSGFSVARLNYLFRHVSAPGQGPAPADSAVIDAVMKIWAALRAVAQDTAITDDPDATLLASRLALVQPHAVVAAILDALDPASALDKATRARTLDDYLGAYLGGHQQSVLADPQPVGDEDRAKRKLDNQAFVLAGLSDWLRTSLSQSAVISAAAASLGLSDAVTRRLLVDWIPGDPDGPGNTRPALTTLLGLAGGGLRAEAFDGPGLTGSSTTLAGTPNIDVRVNSAGGPRSLRWTGQLLPIGDGEHIFVARTDGTVRLTVAGHSLLSGGEPVERDSTGKAITIDHTAAAVALAANALADIEVDYDVGADVGSFQLLWRLASAPAAVPIASEYLFPPDGVAALDASGRGPGFAWRRAHKAALLIAGFGLSEAEIDYMQAAARPFGDLQLRDLPMAPAAHSGRDMTSWHHLAAFVAVRSSLPATEPPLVDLLADPPRPAGFADPAAPAEPAIATWAQRLCDATGWDPATVQALLDDTDLTPADWADLDGTAIASRLLVRVAGPIPGTGDAEIGKRLQAMQKCLNLAQRVGVTVASLQGWTAEEPSAASALEIVQAVRARYPDDAQWLQIAQWRNDTLRQAQRDALVAHVMNNLRIDGQPPTDTASLFEHFLIDTQTSPCGLTSRVKQAISSVQLFIDRCLLGLEQGVRPNLIDPDHWAWNKNYRIWQANRQIFLTPEDWIDPELRIDATPFFADLQSDLSQGPLDTSNVENAFVTFLEKLEQVSRLQVCAMHWQREDDSTATATNIDTLHVVARTPGAHATFFYRSLLGVDAVAGGVEWTPWQRIDLDIQGDGSSGDVPMILTVYDRRLYLFWAVFTEVPEPTQPGANQGESPPPPLTHWEVRLAWSTYRDGSWSPKQVSSDIIRSDRFITSGQTHGYTDAVDAVKRQKELLKKQASDAANSVTDAEQALWYKLQTLRNALFNQLNATGLNTIPFRGAPNYVSVIMSLLFPRDLAGVPALEQWIDSSQGTFTGFLDAIYTFAAEVRRLFKDIPNQTADTNQQLLVDDYNSVLDLKSSRETARSRYSGLSKTWNDFTTGSAGSTFAIPELVRRIDHTFWLSTTEGVQVHVLHHEGTPNPVKLGYFALSDDGRSISATPLTPNPHAANQTPLRFDTSAQVPADSTPQVNAFAFDTGSNKGLDLQGLPNLLGRTHDATFLNEHWFNHPVTADSPRPFFVSKNSDLHLALPVPTPPASDAPGSDGTKGANTAHFGVNTKQAESAAALAPGYRVEPFHHPFVTSLISRLNRDGIDGLLTVAAQNPTGSDNGDTHGHFDNMFAPGVLVAQPYPPYDIDFRPQGAYSEYNWELFFHAPLLIAQRLRTDGRYEDARTWLHYIFDPTTASKDDPPTRFWKFQPLRDNNDERSADELMTALADPDTPPALANSIAAQIGQWQAHPADPHRIARGRLSSYQKAVVFAYLDVLIAGGDSLFVQNTIESINEATQWYVMAGHLLGPRPQHIPPSTTLPPFTYATVRGSLDELSDVLVEVEGVLFPFGTKSAQVPSPPVHALLGISHLAVTRNPATPISDALPDQTSSTKTQTPPVTLAFCVPPNAKLLGYWDTIDDRLWKIRNCMNIEGVVQNLPLFDPPIDPALLVRAAAAGLDIGSIMSDLGAPLPFHRFPVILQKALELCGELKSLGAQLLSALEKRDGETMALLRATHETRLLTAVRDVRTEQLADANTAKKALLRSRDVVDTRRQYYASRAKISDLEQVQIATTITAQVAQIAASLTASGAAPTHLIVDVQVGPTGMGAHATAEAGGAKAGRAAMSVSDFLNIGAQAGHTGASIMGLFAGYDRRWDDWGHQKTLAETELTQIDQQLIGADIRIAIATQELNNQNTQIDHATNIEETLRTKYTNTQLYSWMLTQIAGTYYQAYKLAYDLAKRAERCYRYELGIEESSFIRFGYWDSLRKGLLAGEQLAVDLKRLDAAHLQADRRDYEITRHISLVLIDPQAFIHLRETGVCEIDLTEELFDADYPGHYFRRLKTVSLTLPCVVGPYTPINCTLTLLSNHIRTSPIAGTPKSYPEQNAPNDARFSHNYGSIQSVATSHGQNDAGLFEVNFRDERYLPFEGAGAVSHWRLELPKDTNAFDFDTLSDVVLRLSYTARDGGQALAASARTSLQSRRKVAPGGGDQNTTATTALRRMFRLRYEFSDAWQAFRNALAEGDAALELPIDQERFPYLLRGDTLNVVGLAGYPIFTAAAPQPSGQLTMAVTPPGPGLAPFTLEYTATPIPMFALSTDLGSPGPGLGTWTLAAKAGFPVGELKDLVLVVTYTASSKTGP